MSEFETLLWQLGLSKFLSAFAENEVEFSDLSDLTDEDIKEIGLPVGPRRRLLKAAGRFGELTSRRVRLIADHQRLTLATNVDFYFCDPGSRWQRGSNENANRLLRQFFPRGADLSTDIQANLSPVTGQLNDRPRKTLEYQTPVEKPEQCVAAIS